MRNFKKNKYTRALSPRKREFTVQNEATTSGIFPLVGTGGPAPCRSGVPRPMSFYEYWLSRRISLDINKRGSALDHGKDTGYKLVPEYIDNCHFGFPFRLSALIIFSQFRIGMECADGGQVQQHLYLPVGNWADLGLSFDAGSGLMLEWGYSGIAGEPSPGIKTCKITSIYNQICGNNETNTFYTGYQSIRGP